VTRAQKRSSDPTEGRATAGLFSQKLAAVLDRLGEMLGRHGDLVIAVICFGVPVPDLARMQGRPAREIHDDIEKGLGRMRHPAFSAEVSRLWDEFLEFASGTEPLTVLDVALKRLGVDPASLCCRHCGTPLRETGWKGYFTSAYLQRLEASFEEVFFYGNYRVFEEGSDPFKLQARPGRPLRYCSTACKQAAYRARRRGAVAPEQPSRDGAEATQTGRDQGE
jgi:hypothetical protein